MRKTYAGIATDITNIKSLITSDGKIDATELQSILNSINDSYGKDVYNVKNYGATGDGTTDDTTAIGLANAAMTSNGRGVLYFPQGNYKVTSTIEITVPCKITGDGGIDSWYNIYEVYDGNDELYGSGFVSKISYYNNTTPCISFPSTGLARPWQMYNLGIRMTHPATPTSGSVGVKSGMGANFKIRDVSILDFYDNMQVNDNCFEYVIDGCHFLNPINANLTTNHATIPDLGDQFIMNCLFRPVYRNCNYHILMNTGGGIKLCNNKFNTSGHPDGQNRANNALKIQLTGSTVDSFITNNSIEHSAQESVIIDGGGFTMHNHTFHGNQIAYLSGSHHALVYKNCQLVAINGNTIVGNTLAGGTTSVEAIHLEDCNGVVIYGNCINRFAGTNNGVYKSTSSSNILVAPTTQV